MRLSEAKQALLSLVDSDDPEHQKNWRPQLLVLVNMVEVAVGGGAGRPNGGGQHIVASDPTATPRFTVCHPALLGVAQMLKKGRGLTMVRTLLKGSPLTLSLIHI